MDKTVLKVKKYIEGENLLKVGDEVVIGVSGGADSICLLTILNELKDNLELTLKVVHINHKIREEAMDDANYVKAICKKMNIPFFYFEENVEKKAKELKMSCEAYGRIFRYNCFNRVGNGNFKIAVAHNKNDKVETFFFNLFRGSGLKGLCSIQNKRDNIIRPILCLERKEIENFLNKNNIDYKIDSTNLEDIYTRNKIRLNIIPYVEKEIQSNVIGNVDNAIDILNESLDFLSDYVDNFCLNKVYIKGKLIYLKIDEFLKEKPIIQKLVLIKCLETFIPSRKDISSKNINDIINICNKNGYKEVSLLNDLVAYKDFGILYIKNKNDVNILEEDFEIPLKEGIYKTPLGIFELSIFDNNFDILEDDNIKYFDFDLINSLKITTINYNQIIYLNDSNNPKKLKDYYNNEKILGTNIIVTDNDNVLWVVGKRISSYFKVTSKTQKVLAIKKY